jgi:hypothetical protein
LSISLSRRRCDTPAQDRGLFAFGHQRVLIVAGRCLGTSCLPFEQIEHPSDTFQRIVKIGALGRFHMVLALAFDVVQFLLAMRNVSAQAAFGTHNEKLRHLLLCCLIECLK